MIGSPFIYPSIHISKVTKVKWYTIVGHEWVSVYQSIWYYPPFHVAASVYTSTEVAAVLLYNINTCVLLFFIQHIDTHIPTTWQPKPKYVDATKFITKHATLTSEIPAPTIITKSFTISPPSTSEIRVKQHEPDNPTMTPKEKSKHLACYHL